MSARIAIKEAEYYERSVALRLPFRFGVVTVTELRQANLRLRVEDESGRSAWGIAAESLVPKWFDKDLAKSDLRNVVDLRRAVAIAIGLYRDCGLATPFDLFAATYRAHHRAAVEASITPLAAGFGPAFIDRAVVDAVGRLTATSFDRVIRGNLVGMRSTPLTPDIGDMDLDRYLSALAPRQAVWLRHTVGLLDPITAEDIPAGGRLEDGLPQTLEEVVAATGARWFKLKLGGHMEADLNRLGRIANVLDRSAVGYRLTLDGNEQYADPDIFEKFWRAMYQRPSLARLLQAISFVEQPIARAQVAAGVRSPRLDRPVIIDESDESLDAFPKALAAGYGGISSKTCKGFYKSILNAARIARRVDDGIAPLILSGEDLTTLAGVSVQQDLALVGLLGISHVERNGHHFIDGMSFAPRDEQRAFLAAHRDLYRLAARPGGAEVVRLRINRGALSLASLRCPGFATATEPRWQSLEAMDLSNSAARAGIRVSGSPRSPAGCTTRRS
jgi:hypothetical protein